MAKRRPQTQPFEQQDPDEEVFQIEFKNDYQKQAYDVYTDNSIVFLLGAAGTGKTHLATAFAIKDILSKQKKKIVLTRPIVESGEKLGFLPGDLEEKINPYMIPIYDCLTKLCGSPNSRTKSRQLINTSTDVAPLAFMRGRTFENSVCIFDEAQNATLSQLKLFLTRMGNFTKMVITGDPTQSDLYVKESLSSVAQALSHVPGVGVFHFPNEAIVRHPLVGAITDILAELEKK